MIDPGNGKLLADRIPGAQLVIFPELGHLLFWQEPGGFVDAVTSFLVASAPNRRPRARRTGGSQAVRRSRHACPRKVLHARGEKH